MAFSRALNRNDMFWYWMCNRNVTNTKKNINNNCLFSQFTLKQVKQMWFVDFACVYLNVHLLLYARFVIVYVWKLSTQVWSSSLTKASSKQKPKRQTQKNLPYCRYCTSNTHSWLAGIHSIHISKNVFWNSRERRKNTKTRAKWKLTFMENCKHCQSGAQFFQFYGILNCVQTVLTNFFSGIKTNDKNAFSTHRKTWKHTRKNGGPS